MKIVQALAMQLFGIIARKAQDQQSRHEVEVILINVLSMVIALIPPSRLENALRAALAALKVAEKLDDGDPTTNPTMEDLAAAAALVKQ